MLESIDNFFTSEEHYSLVDYCLRAPYTFGETDNPSRPPIGMVSDISEDDPVHSFLRNEIESRVEAVQDLTCYANYINYFVPTENPYFHTDCDVYGITCLYYLGPIEAMLRRWRNPDYEYNMGGETQFIINGESVNVLPQSNRLCIFDSRILHRATSFRNHYRFTIAVKYR